MVLPYGAFSKSLNFVQCSGSGEKSRDCTIVIYNYFYKHMFSPAASHHVYVKFFSFKIETTLGTSLVVH